MQIVSNAPVKNLFFNSLYLALPNALSSDFIPTLINPHFVKTCRVIIETMTVEQCRRFQHSGANHFSALLLLQP